MKQGNVVIHREEKKIGFISEMNNDFIIKFKPFKGKEIQAKTSDLIIVLPLYPLSLYLREPSSSITHPEPIEVSSYYARKGSHWVRYYSRIEDTSFYASLDLDSENRDWVEKLIDKNKSFIYNFLIDLEKNK